LAKLNVLAFGPGEFALRLPSVAAGFAMMLGIFAVLTECQRPWVRWTAYLAVGLHPLLLDFSMTARGYGLGLALLVWAIHALQKEREVRAGVLLGLGIAANLTIAIPGVALVVMARRWQDVIKTVATAGAVAAAICGYPMRGVSLAQFYVGLERWDESLKDLVYTATRVVNRGTGLFGSEQQAIWISRLVLPVELALCLVMGWRKRVPVALALVLAILVAVHLVVGMKYPTDRTGLYIVLLAALSWALATDRAPRWLMLAQMLAAGLFVVQFATQLQWTTFRVWPTNATAKVVALRLREECVGKAPGSVRVHMFFPEQPSLEYYRERYEIPCVQPFERSADLQPPGYDYYVSNTEVRGGMVLYQGSNQAVSLVRAPAAAK
jgi:hypothetical protein